MQRFIVALAGAAAILAAGCSNQAMEANKTGTSTPGSQTAVQQAATPPATASAPAATPATPGGAPATTIGEDGATRITVDEALKVLKSGSAILVDVRTDEQYKTQHAVGAIHIPSGELTTRVKELPEGKYIITYCS